MSQRQVRPVGSNDSVRGTGAGALALKGLPIEAAEVCAAARRLSPNFTIAKFRAEAVSDNPVYLAQRERLLEGLRLAGAPER
jgi:hypothetical protein